MYTNKKIINTNIILFNTNFECKITDKFSEIASEINFKDGPKNKKIISELLLASAYCKTYFCVVYKNNKVVFFTYFQFLQPNQNTVKKISEPSQTSALMGMILGLANLKIVVLGNIFKANTDTYIFDSQEIDAKTALHLWLETGELLAKKLKSTALVAAEIIANSEKGQFMIQNGFLQQFPDVCMDMQIHPNWQSINDYVGELTKKYAARHKKISELFTNLTVKTLSLAEIEANQLQLQTLYLQTIEDQDFVFSQVEAPFWEEMQHIHGENFKINAIFENQNLVAFYSTLETQNALEMYYLGFDKKLNEKYALYFNMLFLGLENAIINKKKLLHLGRTSLDAKLNIGAKRVEKAFFIKLFALKGKMLDAWMTCQWKDRTVKTIERNPLKKHHFNNTEKTSTNIPISKTLMA